MDDIIFSHVIEVMEQLGGERALIHANDLIEMDPNGADPFVLRGYIFIEMKKWDKALVDYNHSIDLDPKSSYAYFCRSEAYYYIGLFEASAADASKAILLDPGLGAGHFQRAMCFARLSRDAEAESELARATDLGYADDSHRKMIQECRELGDSYISKYGKFP
jgi:tetratricopeptide (TPR) repeat protein